MPSFDLALGAPADPAADTAAVLAHLARLRGVGLRVLGFPHNLAFDYSALGPALALMLDNTGDPDTPGAITVGTKPFEQQVVRFITDLAGGNPDRVYGHVTASGTESLLWGLHTARRRLPRAPLYVSQDAHHSVLRIADVLGLPIVIVPTSPDGTMAPDALYQAVARHARADTAARAPRRGAIVVATIGTTMRGASDDPAALKEAARAAGAGSAVHVHVDAALGGLVAAFAPSRPSWGFAHGADSLCVSGHKLLGRPLPCSIALARADLVLPWPDHHSPYLDGGDRTLACTRSGLTPLLLWMALRRLGRPGLHDLVTRCLHTAAYAHRRLAALDWHPWRAPDSLTVTFDRPSAATAAKWHLAVQGDRAHIVTVGHVTSALVDALCADLAGETRPAPQP